MTDNRDFDKLCEGYEPSWKPWVRIGLFFAVAMPLAAGFVIFSIFWGLSNAWKDDVVIIPFCSTADNDTVYLKRVSWGVTGDHQITVISKSADKTREIRKNSEYWIDGFSTVYYRFANDRLEVLSAPRFRDPEQFNTRMKMDLRPLEGQPIAYRQL